MWSSLLMSLPLMRYFLWATDVWADRHFRMLPRCTKSRGNVRELLKLLLVHLCLQSLDIFALLSVNNGFVVVGEPFRLPPPPLKSSWIIQIFSPLFVPPAWHLKDTPWDLLWSVKFLQWSAKLGGADWAWLMKPRLSVKGSPGKIYSSSSLIEVHVCVVGWFADKTGLSDNVEKME